MRHLRRNVSPVNIIANEISRANTINDHVATPPSSTGSGGNDVVVSSDEEDSVGDDDDNSKIKRNEMIAQNIA